MIWMDRYAPNVIFDIGSYNGELSLKFKEKYPNARVIAIEADNENYNKMINNKKLKDIEIYNYAVGDKDGELLFYPSEGDYKGSGSVHKPTETILKFKNMKIGEPYKVQGISLATFCKDQNITYIDFLQMDIHGSEYETLLGLGNIKPKMIFLEVSALAYYSDSKPTRNKLIELGYKKIISIQGDELWTLKSKKENGTT